jgi:hypothetical protein
MVTNKGDLRNVLKLNCGTIGLQTREELRAEGVPDYLIPHKVLVWLLGADMMHFCYMVGFRGNPFPVLV